MNKVFITIVFFFAFYCRGLILPAQNTILNEALRLTDSMIVDGVFVNSAVGISVIPDTSKIIKVVLNDIFEGDIIDTHGLALNYDTASTEYDDRYMEISIGWYDDDYLKYYGCDYVDVFLTYYISQTLPYYMSSITWNIMYFIENGKITHFRKSILVD